ncbi:MAG: IS91 family transposase [Desulfobacteraceae bacterium]|nr:IS91 family transposase [Desulfobacteraceae bacterium]
MRTNNERIVPIKKPSFEVAEILREYIGPYQDAFPLFPEHYKIVHNLLSCRTSELGGHMEKCDHCGTERISYNSCRNRHCPKCQNMPREKWLEARKAELLPVPYYHNVFTLPHDLNPLILSNKRIMLNILFKAVSQTLLEFGQNPKNGLGGKLGFIAILHTWDQQLNAHFHLHCLIPGGVLKTDGSWEKTQKAYLFNVKAMSKVFRGKFLDLMTKAYRKKGLAVNPDQFKKLKESLYSKNWVVYIQKPIKRPEYVLEYLGRYTHRVAISNHRIISVDDGKVTFKYKNRKTKKTVSCTITAVEFIRRFLLHSLPLGFMRIRYYGFLSNRRKSENIKRIRAFLGQSTEPEKEIKKSIEEMMLKLTGTDITLCPCCKKGKMRVVAELPKKTSSVLPDIIWPSIKQKAA